MKGQILGLIAGMGFALNSYAINHENHINNPRKLLAVEGVYKSIVEMNDYTPRLNEADTLIKKKRYDDARIILKELSESNLPEQDMNKLEILLDKMQVIEERELVKTHYRDGMKYFKKKDYENALDEFDAILDIIEDDKRADNMYKKTENILKRRYKTNIKTYEKKGYYGNALLSLLRLEQLVDEDDENNPIKNDEEKKSELLTKFKETIKYSVIITPFKTQYSEFNSFHNDLLSEIDRIKPSNVSIIEKDIEIDEKEDIEESDIKEDDKNRKDGVNKKEKESIDVDLVITGAITNFYIDTQHNSETKFIRCKIKTRDIPNPEYERLRRIVDRLESLNEAIDKQCKSEAWSIVGSLLAEDDDAVLEGMLSTGVKCTKTPTVGGYDLSEAISELNRTPRSLKEDVYDDLSYTITTYKKKGRLKIDYRLVDAKNSIIIKSDGAQSFVEDEDSSTKGNLCIRDDSLTSMSAYEIRNKLVNDAKNEMKSNIKTMLDKLFWLKYLEKAKTSKNENKKDVTVEDYLRFLISSKEVGNEDDESVNEAIEYINKIYNLNFNIEGVDKEIKEDKGYKEYIRRDTD